MAKKQTNCAYNRCSSKEPLQKCPYCGYCFCDKHIKAKNAAHPSLGGGGDRGPMFMEEWREDNGHPCPEYIRHLIEESKEQEAFLKKEAALKEEAAKKNTVTAAIHSASGLAKSASGLVIRPVRWVYSALNDFFFHFFVALLDLIKILIAAGIILAVFLALNSYFNFVQIPNPSDLIGNAGIGINQPENKTVKAEGSCTSTWLSGTCNPNRKPLYCINGMAENRSSACGCDAGLRPYMNYCIPEVICSDGTFAPDCSPNKPYQCVNGTLVSKASNCGCPSSAAFKKIGDICVDVTKEQASLIEKRIHELINAERQKSGLKSLSFDSNLSDVARLHSQDMLNNDYFEHINLINETPSQRANRSGYSCYKTYGDSYTDGIGENIGQAYTYAYIYYTDGVETRRDWYTANDTAELVVTGWMNSPEHRANILNNNYDKEGIGVAISIEGKIMMTQDFC